jgi:hypothetical protein
MTYKKETCYILNLSLPFFLCAFSQNHPQQDGYSAGMIPTRCRPIALPERGLLVFFENFDTVVKRSYKFSIGLCKLCNLERRSKYTGSFDDSRFALPRMRKVKKSEVLKTPPSEVFRGQRKKTYL